MWEIGRLMLGVAGRAADKQAVKRVTMVSSIG